MTVIRRLVALTLVAGAVTLWSAALLAAPFAVAPRLSAVVYAAGSLVCHQRPERSFHVGEAQVPVCARCLGLYTGAVLGVAAWCAIGGVGSVRRPRSLRFLAIPTVRRTLLLAALPTLATVALGWLGVADPGNDTRFALALPLGAVAAALVAAVAAGDLR